MIVAVPWNLAYSVHTGTPVFFQTGLEKQISSSLNPLVQGYVYPFAPHSEPSGLRFIVDRPFGYVSLVGRRILYLIGARPESWFVESSWTLILMNHFHMTSESARISFLAICLVLFGLGLRAASIRARASTQPVQFLPLALVGPIATAMLVFNTSNRYWVPIIPAVICFQVLAVLWFFEWLDAQNQAADRKHRK